MNKPPESSKLLSLILLSYYSKDRIGRCYDRIRTLLDSERIPFEFIVMDDGSKDESYALALELDSNREMRDLNDALADVEKKMKKISDR